MAFIQVFHLETRFSGQNNKNLRNFDVLTGMIVMTGT